MASAPAEQTEHEPCHRRDDRDCTERETGTKLPPGMTTRGALFPSLAHLPYFTSRAVARLASGASSVAASVELFLRVITENYASVRESHTELCGDTVRVFAAEHAIDASDDHHEGVADAHPPAAQPRHRRRRHRRRGQRPWRGTLIVVHGINPRGSYDPRLEGVAKAFAAVGFRVLMPNIAPLQRVELSVDGIARVERMIREVAARVDLCPSGRVSVFSASVSGAMSIIAASRERTNELVRAICVVGGFASCATVSSKIMRMPAEEDDYGRNVMFYNFIALLYGECAQLRRALYLAVLDNYYLRRGKPDAQLPAYLAERPAVAEQYWRLQNDVEYRRAIAARISAMTAELMRAMSPVAYLDGLRCGKIVLVHGNRDEVVPASEASMLYERMRAAGLDVELCMTSLIGHGDRVLPRESPRSVAVDALRLVTAWASFVEAATMSTAARRSAAASAETNAPATRAAATANETRDSGTGA